MGALKLLVLALLLLLLPDPLRRGLSNADDAAAEALALACFGGYASY